MIVFDLSRLLARARHPTPTGIDRVEHAYARHLLAGTNDTCFVRATAWGGLALLPRPLVAEFVGAVAALWGEGSSVRRRARVRWTAARLRLGQLGRRRPRLAARLRAAPSRAVYLLASHRHLENRRLLSGLKRRHEAAFICLVHDLIPIDFPEYARARQDRRHRRRIDAAAALADAVIVPSAATGEALRRYVARGGRSLRVVTAPFGVEAPPVAAAGAGLPARPYFVCLGTIEPRKNHLLLLNLWRELVGEGGDHAPALLLIGRRGWEIENTIDMLDRCAALNGTVSENRALSDSETARVLKSARALLLPSFAEGFGFPLGEALALGTPVLASDIPALRELGGAAPEYFAPLDGAAWRRAILDYAADPSPRRQAQLDRLATWRAPLWADHFAAVDALLADLESGPGRR
ncbi:MAG: glycosyltransferase family 1 protein [Stellaceae bacterium]